LKNATTAPLGDLMHLLPWAHLEFRLCHAELIETPINTSHRRKNRAKCQMLRNTGNSRLTPHARR